MYYPYFQGRRLGRARNQEKASSKDNSEDGSSMFLENFGKLQPEFMASHPSIFPRVRVTPDGVLDWRLDLLTSLTHDS
jgi:hypothetical protein